MYNDLLAILSLTPTSDIQIIANFHLVVLLLVTFGVQAWSYLVPFALSDQGPAELCGWLTWLHVGLLGFVAVVVPLCIPRLYIPLDPKNPTTHNPEQTASLISLITCTYLDPVIFASYRASKLEYDELPPLADYDHAAALRQRRLGALDPMQSERNRKRHVFWGLMQLFWREYVVMTVLVTIKVRNTMRDPQNPSEPQYFRPWVWVLWLFLAPVLGSLSMQRYYLLASCCIVRAEAIITQILFEHSLRIRMIAAVANKTSGTSNIATERTTTEQGAEGSDHTADTSEAQTVVACESSATTKGNKQDDEEPNLIGEINNLMSTDLGNIVDGRNFVFLATYAPIQITCPALLLYWILGWSAVVGMTCMALFFPLPGRVAHLVNRIQGKKMKKVPVIRMIKLFGWETKIRAQVEEKRETELHWYKKKRMLVLVNLVTNYILPSIVMMITFACHTLAFKQSLDASMVFSSIAIFEFFRNQLHFVLSEITTQVQAKVSLDRVNDFMKNASARTELLDAYTTKYNPRFIEPTPPCPCAIGFPSTPTPPTRNFRLVTDQELLFHRGKTNMIIGPTGCGKTCLLLALLGEMHFTPSTPDSWFVLPRDCGVAYAAQEAWVLNETIRDNVLFGSKYDEGRYNKVLSQCALDKDLALLDAGDQTEEIVLLDDVLSALDVHTSRWIVDNCFRGDLVTGRTVLIVTHNVAMVSEVADFVVSLGTNGRVVSQGYVLEVFRTNAGFRAEVEKGKQLEEKTGQTIEEIESREEERPENTTKKRDGKLMVQEEMVIGHIGWPALKLFLFSFGGFWFWLACLGSFMLADAVLTLQSYWIGVWARAYSTYAGHPEQTSYLAVYISICLTGVCTYSGAYIMHILGSVRAARRIHGLLVASILGAPLRWLDSTPAGRIIARFSQDIRPHFMIPGITILAGGFWVGRIYIRSQLSVKREMSNARSLIFSHFGTALVGITLIRAYGVEDHFKNVALKRIDKYTRAGRTFYNLNCWISVRMDALGGTFATGLAAYLVYVDTSPDASNTGFSLNRAVLLSASIIWWVHILNEFEVQSNSLERIQEITPAHWPSSGNISVENLTARYSPGGPAVLHGLSFEIKSGECIGIVGRTGSGKSSLTLSLLRMIPIEGNIYYDGIPTHVINLDALRSNITIISQQPELMSGTVRQNLDPFEEHDDAFLNAALHSAGLNSIQPEDIQGQIGLDTEVSVGGSNFSLGQRQILALARATVWRSKVLILDEATAVIDYNVDATIQTSIRAELKDITLIIVAHRLQTICDADKIMVLDCGKIVELDSPVALLQKEDGIFKFLVDESGDKDRLYAMAKGQ
ncbi:P-loop containing nucleoside triphosphate hydrolase protein [Rhizoctonia solani]|nr:P-loop containing nucleoside triphosphate hydrolase protein [Rhizoctonia solani]